MHIIKLKTHIRGGHAGEFEKEAIWLVVTVEGENRNSCKKI